MAVVGSIESDSSLDIDVSLAFTQEIHRSALASLEPLQEDLAEWLSRVLGIKICSDSMIEALSNGVLPCKLAQVIQQKVVEKHRSQEPIGFLPVKLRFKERAPSESFIARDNVATFLSWCRDFGLADTCLFETDDLVLKRDPKNVLVCIYELARMASQYGIDPPGLVKLEREIEKEERHPRPISARPTSSKKQKGKLEKEVQSLVRTCSFNVEVERISEGKYSIAGKTVFVRILGGKHLMVRVGGGWDTLQNYLSRHEVTRLTRVKRNLENEAAKRGGRQAKPVAKFS